MSKSTRIYPTVTNAVAKRALKKIQNGDSLRKIGAELGISNQTVWRIGDRNGVYSKRAQ